MSQATLKERATPSATGIRQPQTCAEFLSAYKELCAEIEQEIDPQALASAEKSLTQYVALLQKWNRITQLVSTESLPEVWSRHIWDSAQLVAFLPAPSLTPPPLLVDLGSGAGFPGLVLATLLSNLEIHLIEANAKKAAFLREAVACLPAGGRGRVFVQATRSETWHPARKADFITARAVAPLPSLLTLITPHLARGGVGLFHQGSAQIANLHRAPKTTLPVGWRFTSHRSRVCRGGGDSCGVP